ncbi:alpha/beta fold hydrolase [Euzebya tangerina]|uniref:alpha/beta fold hydrolase n=1 Tax=Euzebya tangerina TaxID=591198 RepID=UPI0013C33C1B|nr:alpha/beta hydrolase [Euzebya tangerina]
MPSPTTTPATIVLVAGAGLGAAAWDLVVPHLEHAGHTVHALTLPGVADRHDEATPQTGLHAHADDLATAIETADLRDVTLVAHSYAGMVTSHALGRLADRLASLVFVAAALPTAGPSLAAQTGEEGMGMIRALADEHGDGWLVPFMPPSLIEQYFGDHDLDADDMAWLQASATPMPLATWTEEASVDPDAWRRVDRTFVVCTGDPGAPPVSDGEDGWTVLQVETGHWPMRTAPAELAARVLAAISS